jgi:hypothetical protein
MISPARACAYAQGSVNPEISGLLFDRAILLARLEERS